MDAKILEQFRDWLGRADEATLLDVLSAVRQIDGNWQRKRRETIFAGLLNGEPSLELWIKNLRSQPLDLRLLFVRCLLAAERPLRGDWHLVRQRIHFDVPVPVGDEFVREALKITGELIHHLPLRRFPTEEEVLLAVRTHPNVREQQDGRIKLWGWDSYEVPADLRLKMIEANPQCIEDDRWPGEAEIRTALRSLAQQPRGNHKLLEILVRWAVDRGEPTDGEVGQLATQVGEAFSRWLTAKEATQ